MHSSHTTLLPSRFILIFWYSPVSSIPKDAINQSIPSVKVCFAKKKPQHMISPERSNQSSIFQTDVEKICRTTYTNRKQEDYDFSYITKVSDRMNRRETYHYSPKFNQREVPEIRRTTQSVMRVYPNYLDEDKDFSFVAR